MPIVIKELFSSDPISEALEKINFNFDQLILSGGGPPGPAGSAGPPGVPGPQGLRGDHWQVGGASGVSGFTGPTSDHGPNYGDLVVGDTWLDSSGKVWYWNGSMWIDSSLNLTGPEGPKGTTGNSLDLNLYQGGTGNVNDGSYVPLVGPTTVAGTNANYWVINNMDLNSFFLGNKDWAYNRLKNFNTRDVYSGISATSAQRMIPKQVIIQSGIDYTGYGGLSIGAYGLTGGTSTSATNFLGGTGQTGIVDGRSFFYAGWSIRDIGTPPSSIFSHTFKMITGYNDMEIQSGSNENSGPTQTGNLNRKISLTSGTINLQGFPLTDGGNDVIRFSSGATYGRYRDALYVGFNSTQNTTLLPGIIVADGYTNTLITNGGARIYGPLRVGNRSTATNQIYIGTERLVDGNSEINMYAGVTNTGLFQIQRKSGANGNVDISNIGTGGFNLNNYASNITLTTSASVGYISFLNASAIETARFDTVTNRLGVGTTTPLTKVHIKADNGDPRVLRLEGNPGAQIELYASGPSTMSGWIGFNGYNNNLGIWNDVAGGHAFFAVKPTSNPLGTFYAGLQQNGVFSVGSNTITGVISQDSIININASGQGSLYLGDSVSQPDDSWRVHNNLSTGQFRISTGAYATPNTRFTIHRNTGNVGIGTSTSTPISRLHLANTDTGECVITLQGTQGNPNTETAYYPSGYTPILPINVDQRYGPNAKEAQEGRFGRIGYRWDNNNRTLFIENNRYWMWGDGTAAGGEVTHDIKMESSRNTYFNVGFIENLDIGSASSVYKQFYTSQNLISLIGGRRMDADNGYNGTDSRVGINTENPQQGYILDISGNTTIRGGLYLGNGTQEDYYVGTVLLLGTNRNLTLGTNSHDNIFIKADGGRVGIGDGQNAATQQQLTNPKAPLQVTVPLLLGAVSANTTGHIHKHQIGRYIGSRADYESGVILLHRASNGTTPIPYNSCKGTFYLIRGGVGAGQITDTIEVDSSSSYTQNQGTVIATLGLDTQGPYNVDPTSESVTVQRKELTRRDNVFLTTVYYDNAWWVALYPGYPISAHDVYFDGYHNSSGTSTFVQDMSYLRTRGFNPGGTATNDYQPTINSTLFSNRYTAQGKGEATGTANVIGTSRNTYHSGVDVLEGLSFRDVNDGVNIIGKHYLDITVNFGTSAFTIHSKLGIGTVVNQIPGNGNLFVRTSKKYRPTDGAVVTIQQAELFPFEINLVHNAAGRNNNYTTETEFHLYVTGQNGTITSGSVRLNIEITVYR
jgi:hypothetical protein